MTTTARPAAASCGWRDDRLWQAGFLVGSALGAAATVLGRRAERVARRGLVDWPRAERIAIDRLRSRAGHADAGRAARDRGRLRGGDGADRAAAREALGTRAARRRRAIGGRRSGRLGPRQRRHVRRADRHARGRAARPGDPDRRRARRKATMALANRWVTTRQLGFLLGFMGAQGPRPVRPRPAVGRGDARPPALRRGEHPPDRARRSTCRSSRSGPGSPSTRRPTPSSSRPIPGSGRISRTGWSASSGSSAARRAGSDERRCAASAGRSAATATAPSTGSSG